MKIILKIIKWIVIVFAGLILASLVLVVTFSFYRPQINNADAAIILGAAINTPALYNRSMEGLRLYQEGKANELVLSGGRISDKDISEAGYMKKVIDANSTGLTKLVLEDQSHNTYENIKNSKNLIGSGKSVIIVSDEFHLARAVLMARREGFGPVYWSAPKPTYYSKNELGFYYMREVFAIISYVPKFILG